MFVTLNANPSLDRSIRLETPLIPGAVNPACETHENAGGKGLNVANALAAAGHSATCVQPLADVDPLRTLLRDVPANCMFTPAPGPCRANLNLEQPDGHDTKINLPGPRFTSGQLTELLRTLVRVSRADCNYNSPAANRTPAASGEESWTALCGSLPPGAPADFYARAALLLKTPPLAVELLGLPVPEAERAFLCAPYAQLLARAETAAKSAPLQTSWAPGGVALDSSGSPLAQAWQAARAAYTRHGQPLVDLFAPNLEEFKTLLAACEPACHARLNAKQWHLEAIAAEARELVAERGTNLFLTLGPAGALYVESGAAWQVDAARIEVVSTVGAGDASLAGFLSARSARLDIPVALERAMEWGAAACLGSSPLPLWHKLASRGQVSARLLF